TLNAAAIQPGADFVQTGEQLFAVGVINHADDRSVHFEGLVATDLGTGMGDEGDGDGVLRNAVQEVGGSIQRINVPGRDLGSFAAALFGNDPKLGCTFQKNFDDRLFGLAIGL